MLSEVYCLPLALSRLKDVASAVGNALLAEVVRDDDMGARKITHFPDLSEFASWLNGVSKSQVRLVALGAALQPHDAPRKEQHEKGGCLGST